MSTSVSTGRTAGEKHPGTARDGHDGAVSSGEDAGAPSGEVAALLDELRRYLDLAPQLSLPPRAFTSPELYELERTRIFGRSWVLIAHRDDFAPNSYVSVDVAGEQVVVTRDADGVLHGMSPICRHRMMPLVEPGAAGSAESFTCPYHLWRYGLDGRLIGATHMRKNPDFDPKSCRLPAFAVEEWHGFVYVNLDAAAAPSPPN